MLTYITRLVLLYRVGNVSLSTNPNQNFNNFRMGIYIITMFLLNESYKIKTLAEM